MLCHAKPSMCTLECHFCVCIYIYIYIDKYTTALRWLQTAHLFNSSPPSASYMHEVIRVSIGSHNCLLLVQHQSINWANTDLLSIGTLGTNLSEIWIKIQTFYSGKYIWKCCLWWSSHFCLVQEGSSCRIYTMIADNLVVQGARASAAMVLT